MSPNKNKLISYLQKHGEQSAKEISEFLQISRQATHRILKQLQEKGLIEKIGKAPKVYYLLKEDDDNIRTPVNFEQKIGDYLEKNYFYISPLGQIHPGLEGFKQWSFDKNQDFIAQSKAYFELHQKINKTKKENLLDGTKKMKDTFAKIALDKVFYLDFYTIPQFGKTKLGQLLLYAKQSQNKQFIQSIIKDIKPHIKQLLKTQNIDAIGFIPPTVKRETQFMKELEKGLNFHLPIIAIEKIKTPIAIPQKTLTKLKDRILNAKKTFTIRDKRQFKNILLIDDAIGSGATLNEVAQKIKDKKVSTNKIIGLAITGSYKGFEVINEV